MGRAPFALSRLYVSAADHPCLLDGGRFSPDHVVRVGVDGNGIVRPRRRWQAALARMIGSDGLPLVAIHAANNETGVIQPFGEIAAIGEGGRRRARGRRGAGRGPHSARH